MGGFFENVPGQDPTEKKENIENKSGKRKTIEEPRRRNIETGFFENVPGQDPTVQNKENTDEAKLANGISTNQKYMTFCRRLAADDLTLGSAETGVLSAIVLLGTFCIFK